MLAVWEIHDDSLGDDYPTSISRGLGLPVWSNHIAFRLDSLDNLNTHISRINSHGIDVTEIDHGWCTSIYINDPNEIMVEFCVTTKAFTEKDKEDALKAITSDAIDDNAQPKVTMHSASKEL
jgi:catechol-2,3-dioxygenase